MAATSIHYNLIQATIPGPPAQYSVQATVTSTVNIDQNVFTYNFTSGLFDHVATVLDMQTYPTSSTPGQPFFRQNTVTQLFGFGNQAIDFATTVHDRLTSLAKEYDIVAAAFVPGTYPIVVP